MKPPRSADWLRILMPFFACWICLTRGWNGPLIVCGLLLVLAIVNWILRELGPDLLVNELPIDPPGCYDADEETQTPDKKEDFPCQP